MRLLSLALLSALAVLGGCDKRPPEQPKAKQQAEPEPDTVDIPQTVESDAPGTTPMGQRVAVIGLLNKRNGIARDLTMRPGQSMRVNDVIVRVRACEATPPWETQKLTGAFVQVDVRNTQDQFKRVFSGWLYKESPSLNVVEHPVYDVWPKSCAMTHPGAGGSTVPRESEASNRSSAAKPAKGAPAPSASPKAAPSNPR